jgi:uncharacterized cupredoxin-like copper-binding protein
MLKKIRWTTLLVLLSSLVLAACGGGKAQAASTHLAVQLTEFAFQPSQFTVPAGKEITLDLSNNGSVEHNFIIMKLGTQASPPFDAADEANVYWEVALPPGQSTSTTFTAPSEPGDYQVVCKTPGHLEAGMVAKLTVVSP